MLIGGYDGTHFDDQTVNKILAQIYEKSMSRFLDFEVSCDEKELLEYKRTHFKKLSDSYYSTEWPYLLIRKEEERKQTLLYLHVTCYDGKEWPIKEILMTKINGTQLPQNIIIQAIAENFDECWANYRIAESNVKEGMIQRNAKKG